MNIYLARWNNAKRIAEKINSLIDAGYLILDENKEPITCRFVIEEDEVYLPLGINCNWIFFRNEPGMDDGLYTTIYEYNKHFSGWTYISPKDIKHLVV